MIDGDSFVRVFEVSKEGEAVFKELCQIFYMQQSHTPGDPYETAFKEGQRSAIQYVINRIQAAKQPQQEEE